MALLALQFVPSLKKKNQFYKNYKRELLQSQESRI